MSDRQTELSTLCQRVRELTAQINASADKRRRKQRVIAVVGVLLAVTMTFSLSGVTNLTRQLDAEAIAQIGRQEVERRLPAARLDVQNYLEREAPRIVAGTLRTMLDSLPQLRHFVFQGLTVKLDQLNFEFEKNTIAIVANMVHASKQEVDDAFPNLSDRERLVKLVELVTGRFSQNISAATTELYPEYEAEMDRIVSHLDRLQHQDPVELTEEERIHKEIVVTLLQLLERRQGHDAAPAPVIR